MTKNTNNEAIESKLTLLTDKYVEQLPEKIEQLRDLWKKVSEGGQIIKDKIDEIKRISHSLAGSGATFGFPKISERARTIELLTDTFVNERKISSEENLQINKLIDQLEQATISCLPGNPSAIFTEPSDLQKKNRVGNKILLVEDDPLLAESLRDELLANQYQVDHLSDSKNIHDYVAKNNPAAIIMDVVLPEGDMAGLDAVQALRDKGYNTPVIIISVRDDIESRLLAARTGAQDYLVKPFKTNDVLYTLDKITDKAPSKPYRVLVVDDDEPLCKFYSLVLEQAGMQARYLSNPLNIVTELEEFEPELILMDLYMPECNGSEIASVIRQYRKYDTAPIIFLSRESDLKRQMEALELGGDDFIIKPVTPEQLSVTAKTRAKRSRTLSENKNRIEATVRELERQRFAIDQHAIVSLSDIDGKIIYTNNRFSIVSGYTQHELLGQDHNILNSGHHTDEFFKDMWETIKSGHVWQGDVKNKSKNEECYWLRTTIVPFLDKSGKPYQYAAIRTDITEQINAKEEADNANMAKSEFLSRMSHELRTPLNAILGFSQLLELDDEPRLTEYQLDNLKEIGNAGHHLLDLINEILDLARIESGNIEINFESVVFEEVIDECINLVTPLAEQRDIKLKVEGLRDVLIVADRIRIKQVLLNLLSNAVKYNKQGGRVDVTVEMSPDNKLRINITDTGVGIPESRQGEVFTSFARLGKEATEGTGIGLVITKHLVEIMGGEIGFVSNPDKGSTFWCQFDINEEQDPSIYKTTNMESMLNNQEEMRDKKESTILYIEDNQANIRLVEGALKRRSEISLITSLTPGKGIEIAINKLPDLIILDINLPEMDGYQVLKEIKLSEETRDIPVIALSANVMPKDIEKGIKAGFEHYLTKPLNIQEFFAVIDGVLELIGKKE